MNGYTQLRKLHRRVYLYQSHTDGTLVAVKKINYADLDREARKQLVEEVNNGRSIRKCRFVLSSVTHINDKETYTLYILNRFYSGGTLLDLAATTVSDARLLLIAAQLVLALSYCAHHGIIHRDVKPAHVALDRAGHAILIGFGRCCKTTSLDRRICQVGTPAFMSPEMVSYDFLGNELIGVKTDVWSLGATLYFVKHGRGPFDSAMTMPALVSNIMHGYYAERYIKTPLYKLIRKMLAVSIQRRPGASELELDQTLRPYIRASAEPIHRRERCLI